jgi:hypothetical protein
MTADLRRRRDRWAYRLCGPSVVRLRTRIGGQPGTLRTAGRKSGRSVLRTRRTISQRYWRQPLLSNWAANPDGIRGAWPSLAALQAGQGAPGAPQSQALPPPQGRSGWRSQIQPLSLQVAQVGISGGYCGTPSTTKVCQLATVLRSGRRSLNATELRYA